MQQVVFHHRYDKDTANRGNPRTGWTYVLTIQDLSQVLDPPLPASANKLQQIWNTHWQELSDNQTSVDAVLKGVDQVRIETLKLLKTLE